MYIKYYLNNILNVRQLLKERLHHHEIQYQLKCCVIIFINTSSSRIENIMFLELRRSTART